MTNLYSLMVVQDHIWDTIKSAIAKAQNAGELPTCDLPTKSLEHPQNPNHGDYSSNIALRLSKQMKINPMQIAELIEAHIDVNSPIESISVANPGFLNFNLESTWVKNQVDEIIEMGDKYGNIQLGNATKIQIEFVSVNPTGPLHIGHARGAVVGSALSNILNAADYKVENEYYVNDAGAQVDNFAESIYAQYKKDKGIDVNIPEDGYKGDYINEIASDISSCTNLNIDDMSEEHALQSIKEYGLKLMLSAIKQDLDSLRVHMDEWFSEKSLYQDGTYKTIKQELNKNNLLETKDGALWFKSSELGDDKDNVVEKSNGRPTYFASDIAYHYNKFTLRNFEFVVNIWGSDHQGHIPRLKTVVNALKIDSSRLKFILTQMVKLKRGSSAVKMSKRSGELITLAEFIKEVGADACRFFFLSRSPDSQLDFDIELAQKQSSENPVYYIQYGHARICSILKNAKENNIQFNDGDVNLLDDPNELNLIKKILALPETVQSISVRLEPHHLAHYALDLSSAFHLYYQNCKVISTDDEELHITKARLKLCEATRITINRCLNLMGMSAPEKM